MKYEDLFRFNGVSELWGERDVGDRDIVQDDVESQRSPRQVFSDKSRNLWRSTGFSTKTWGGLFGSVPSHVA